MELSVHVRARSAARAAIRPATVATRWWGPTAARLGLGLERPCAVVRSKLLISMLSHVISANPCSIAPPVANGVVSACEGTVSGSSCSPTCTSGYSLVGTYSCLLGTWSGTPVCNGE